MVIYNVNSLTTIGKIDYKLKIRVIYYD